MVYYIRFLKTPRSQIVKPGLVSVSALITITTDLGDAFLAEDVALQTRILGSRADANAGSNENGDALLHEKSYTWEAGKRELPISIGPIRIGKIPHLVLAIGTQSLSTKVLDTNLKDLKKVPLVISGWSAPFSASQELPADKLIERRFVLQDDIHLKVWEETGNNLARHIWDAALAAIMCLQSAIHIDTCSMRKLCSMLQGKRKKLLQIIELGSGCGVVGIALAQMLSRCSVTLTDLPEVHDIVSRNLRLAQPALESASDFKVLDWEEELDGDALKQPIDIILVSDCTYNADSLPSLVQVLSRLVQLSPGAVVLVSLKRRHESEAVFFELMRQSAFAVVEESVHMLPAPFSEEDQIEMYLFACKNQG